METKSKDIIGQNKIFLWIALATAAILSIPLIAMQFKDDVIWELEDFIIIAILLFGAGSTFIFVARVIPKKYRVSVGVGFVLAVLLIWAHLAVGIVDGWPLAGS